MNTFRKFMAEQSELALVLLLAGVLLVLFAPIPAAMLDVLIVANFACALLILLLTFYMARPLEFSTFPSLLLVATLFRLGLNVAATRLILSSAYAGEVIAAIGHSVVSGNYVIGLIVFVVLIIVQYVVVTNGAQRVAEVAARFTLDSMPGKQMSIDADLNMGLIDQAEAKERRRNVEREANFYGAMDGASRFVKGDAIAGILILLVDIVGGLTIGVVQHGLSWAAALQTYTLLTIGDGIVTQVPALVIATATGIIVTRAASDARLGAEVTKQILAHPPTIFIVSCVLLLLAFLPGMPLLPIGLLAGCAGFLFWRARKRATRLHDAAVEHESSNPDLKSERDREDLYRALQVDPVEIIFGAGLVSVIGMDGQKLAEPLAVLRKQYALDMGVVLPAVRAREVRKLNAQHYEINIFATRVAEGVVYPDCYLAINPGGTRPKLPGVTATDPAYGLPAQWIEAALRQQAKAAGYTVVEADTVLLTHLTEVLKQQAANLITRAETERLVAGVRTREASLVEELIPKVLSLGEVQRVLQALVRERISIRNLDEILAILVEVGARTREPDVLTEQVRERLGRVICQSLCDAKGEIQVLTLDPKVEQTLTAAMRAVEDRTTLVLEPRFAEQIVRRLSEEVERMVRGNVRPVLLCSANLRRHIRRFTERLLPQLAILSLNEVPAQVSLRAFAVVTV